MPARKLSQADVDDLRDADTELLRSRPRPITRPNPNGDGEVTLSTLRDIAAWKGISESHYYVLKRGRWKHKRGLPNDDRSGQDVVPAVPPSTVGPSQERVDEKDRRIAELEAEVRRLRAAIAAMVTHID